MIISGRDLAAELRKNMAVVIARIRQKYGRVPSLAVVLVGDDPASHSYVKAKSKAAEEVGLNSKTIYLPDTCTEQKLLSIVEELNADDLVDGILVQLPLPKHINDARVIDSISSKKDVDGFHSANVASLWTAKDKGIVPCTPLGIIKLLEHARINLEGKRAVVLGRSQIVGLPVAKLLLDRHATVTICHSRTKNLKELTREADILVAAIGKAKFVTKDMVKQGAVVIDVGVNRDPNTGKLCGDVDFDSLLPIAGYISPVPGGVGPMTICCLLENTIKAFLDRNTA